MIKKLWEKIKQGWAWLKSKTKQLLISLGIVGIAVAAGTTAIPQEITYRNIPLTSQQQQELMQIVDYQTSRLPLEGNVTVRESWILGNEIINIEPTRWRMIFRSEILYYKDGEVFKSIDLTLQDSGDSWQATKSNYHPKIAKYADEWSEFRNVFKGNDHTVRIRPVAGHVQGIVNGEGEMNGREVLYRDAFREGIDLGLYVRNNDLVELVIIRQTMMESMSFDVEVELPKGEKLRTYNTKTKDRMEVDFRNSISVMNKDIEVGLEDNPTVIYEIKVWDSAGNKEVIPAILYKNGNKMFIRKTIPAEFLEKATYPVYTDATFSVRVAASTDDCYFRDSDDSFSTDYSVVLAGDFDGTYYDNQSGMRFLNVTIPQGATINSSYITFRASSLNGSIPTTILEGEKVADAATFSTVGNYTGRTRTTANVSWAPAAWVANTSYNSADISTVISEIVGQATWVSGYDLVIFWRDAVGYGSAGDIRAQSWDTSSVDAPLLYVDYTEAVNRRIIITE